MKSRIFSVLVSALFAALMISQTSAQPLITTFRVDGLIISKARFDSLKLERTYIVMVRSIPPASASAAFGQRASAGVAIISTSKMFILSAASGAVRTARDPQQKESMLANINEGQTKTMGNIDAQTLLNEFKV